MNRKCLLMAVALLFAGQLAAQKNYWQQKVAYWIKADVDVQKNKIYGKQNLVYENNSPDDLKKVFFHLYWNAFQPGSEMDVRSRELGKIMTNGRPDWDSRVRDRIFNLDSTKIGYQRVTSLKINGVAQKMRVVGTILEVELDKPILSNSSVTFDIEFEAQVPVQIRRSGRDNAEGVRYSMSQWYPKIAEYDFEGHHPAQYVAREFYGVWGDFDVSITIDKDYKLAGTGVLQNAAEIGWGYDKAGSELKKNSKAKRTWHFIGKNIHDFVWAADPDYEHIRKKVNGVDIHVIHKKDGDLKSWETLADAAVTVLPYIEKRFGKYPYPQYSFIQGGDGGMEYAMATLIKGPSLGTAFHEWMHNWYHMVLATNENKYPWMDEGFTSWATAEVTAYYNSQKGIQTDTTRLPLNQAGSYAGYYALMKSGFAEPMSTWSDHYETNFAYSVNAYSRGAMVLEQLGYIMGDSLRDAVLLRYYDKWKFKHPTPNDFIRVAEEVSGMQLQWFFMYWIQTLKTVDYKIDSLWEEGAVTKIRVKRIGHMPMPIDVKITFKDSTNEVHNIPLDLMFAHKPAENKSPYVVHGFWNWTDPTYVFEVNKKLIDIQKVEIDPTRRLPDVDQSNNTLDLKW